jgi:hypothetical protein
MTRITIYALTVEGNVSEQLVYVDAGRNILSNTLGASVFTNAEHGKCWFYSRDDAYQAAVNQQYKRLGNVQQEAERIGRLIDRLHHESLEAAPPPSVDPVEEPENPNCYCHEIPGGSAEDPILCSYCEAEI